MTRRRCGLVARRVLVVLGLLLIPPLSTYIWHRSLNAPSSPLLQQYGQPLAYFCWSLSHNFAIVGVWLATRHKVFTTVGGWIRTLLYVLFTCYGFMTFYCVQDWINGNNKTMEIPGTEIGHYGGGVLAMQAVLTVAWLSWPLQFFLRRRLTDEPLSYSDIPRPNVRFFLAWTAMAVLLLVAVRLLAQYGKPLNVAPASMPVEEALIEYASRLPLDLVHALSIIITMIVVSSHPRRWLWGIPLAIAFRCVGEQLVFATVPGSFGVVNGPVHERAPYFAGGVVIVLVVIFVARMTALRYQAAVTLPSNVPVGAPPAV